MMPPCLPAPSRERPRMLCRASRTPGNAPDEHDGLYHDVEVPDTDAEVCATGEGVLGVRGDAVDVGAGFQRAHLYGAVHVPDLWERARASR